MRNKFRKTGQLLTVHVEIFMILGHSCCQLKVSRIVPGYLNGVWSMIVISASSYYKSHSHLNRYSGAKIRNKLMSGTRIRN